MLRTFALQNSLPNNSAVVVVVNSEVVELGKVTTQKVITSSRVCFENKTSFFYSVNTP
jgi:hypothetical protein